MGYFSFQEEAQECENVHDLLQFQLKNTRNFTVMKPTGKFEN